LDERIVVPDGDEHLEVSIVERVVEHLAGSQRAQQSGLVGFGNAVVGVEPEAEGVGSICVPS